MMRLPLMCALLGLSGAASVQRPDAVSAKMHPSSADLSLQPGEDRPLGSALRATAGATPTSGYVFGPEGGSAGEYEAFLYAGLAATPEACKQPGFPHVYRHNCLLRHSTSKHTELDASLSLCDWVKEDGSFSVQWIGPMAVPEWTSEDAMHPPDTHFERCFLKNHDSFGHFEALRVGPVTTNGSYDWTKFTVEDFTLKALDDVRQSTPSQGVFAATEMFAGAMAANGTLLSYPPIHQHHFHVAELDGYRSERFGQLTGQYDVVPSTHAVITHGDDVCLHSSGGVDCTIRRMVPGYATMLRAPFKISTDMNDVRASNSEPLTYYMLFTVRGLPRDGTLMPFTELRVTVQPFDASLGYAGVYLVKSDRLAVYWRQSIWLVNATVISSYAHTHPLWLQEYMLYTGADGTQLNIDSLGVTKNATYLGRDAAETATQQLAARAKLAGASLVCRYKRSPKVLEKIQGTSELNGSFYRLAAGCVPFRMSQGEPFVYFVITSPDSDAAAASIGADTAHPSAHLAGMHTWFRLYISVEDQGMISANCEQCFFAPSLLSDYENQNGGWGSDGGV